MEERWWCCSCYIDVGDGTCCGEDVSVTAIRNTEGGLDAVGGCPLNGVVEWFTQHGSDKQHLERQKPCSFLSETGFLEFVSCCGFVFLVFCSRDGWVRLLSIRVHGMPVMMARLVGGNC